MNTSQSHESRTFFNKVRNSLFFIVAVLRGKAAVLDSVIMCRCVFSPACPVKRCIAVLNRVFFLITSSFRVLMMFIVP